MANLNIKTALTGGTINCVDRNSAGMKVDGSVCFALIDGSPNVLRVYKFDAASTATANGNTVIIPYGQSGGTAGRWLQHGIMIGSLTPELLGYIGNLTSDAQAQLNEIQTQIGSYRGVLSSSAATVTLTAEHRGHLVVLYSGGAQTVYLPQESGLPVGWSVTVLIETLTGSAIIDPYGQIDSGNGLVNSLTMRGMEEARLTWDGSYWRLGGSALRAVGEAFGSGTLNGMPYWWEKRLAGTPSGYIIEQLGATAVSASSGTITFPIAFPTALLNIQLTVKDDDAGNSVVTTNGQGLTSFNYISRNVDNHLESVTIYWSAKGY